MNTYEFRCVKVVKPFLRTSFKDSLINIKNSKMKKRNPILILVIVFFTSLILISCSGSVKGKWSESDKQSFRKDMEEIEELSSFGENKTKWIECYLSKCEANYSSYAEADMDEKGCEKNASECYDEVLSNGSVKGKWSESDKQKFRADMDGLEELSSFGENKTKWIECYLSKCEANYSSYHQADSDEEGCEKNALECYDEIN